MFGECHAHLFMNGMDYRKAVRDHKTEVQTERIKEEFAAYQRERISFVRDGGDKYGVSEKARELAPFYGIDYRSPVFAIHRKGHYGGIVGAAAENLKEYAELVRKVKQKNGDFVKIMVSGIMEYEEYGRLSEDGISSDWIHEMIHIAHEEGFAVMVHVNGSREILEAVEAGADSIEHGNYADEECICAMEEHECVWVPTIVTTKNLLGCGRYPERVLRQIYEMESENLKKAFEKGVKLAAGSDAGAYLVPHGKGLVQEVTIFTEVLEHAGYEKKKIEERLCQGEEQIRNRFCRNS